MGDQADILTFLRSDAAFGNGAADENCSTVSTHISTVLLIGRRALKLKRPISLPYLDFSTSERRLAACLDELRLNRRTAPKLYRAVHRVTRERDGRLALNGDGTLLDAVVEMERFDESQLFDRLARERLLTIADVEQLANVIAKFHTAAEGATGGGADRFAHVLAVNETSLKACRLFGAAEIADLTRSCRAEFEQVKPLLDSRARAGFIRRGHGDLHLRNICRIDGVPTLFDCLEFDEELATTDVLYDLAFVLMDLWRRDLRVHANVLLNRYLDATEDEAGLALMPLFMAVRAVIRAHVVARGIASTELGMAWNRAEARAYAKMAHGILAACPAKLVSVSGYSGSGKSSVAMRVAPDIGRAPGARVLSSDRIRKQLLGVSPATQLDEQAYAAPISETVYRTLRACAGRALATGHSVVADAVFDRASERGALAALAADLGVPFYPLWLEAPADILMRRVGARTGDPSDATPAVVMEQLYRDGQPYDWPRLCAVGDLDAVCEAAHRLVELRGPAVLAKPCKMMRRPSKGTVPLSCTKALTAKRLHPSAFQTRLAAKTPTPFHPTILQERPLASDDQSARVSNIADFSSSHERSRP